MILTLDSPEFAFKGLLRSTLTFNSEKSGIKCAILLKTVPKPVDLALLNVYFRVDLGDTQEAGLSNVTQVRAELIAQQPKQPENNVCITGRIGHHFCRF